MPGRELAIFLAGLVVLVAAWVFVFMSAQERLRSTDTGAEPAAETTAAGESAASDAEEPVTEEPATEEPATEEPASTEPAE